MQNNSIRTSHPTRRRIIARIAVAFGGLAVTSRLWGRPQQAMTETQSTGADRALTFLHQEINFKASAQRIYEVLLDSKQFAIFTGMPAEIDPKAGGAFSIFGERIVGRNIELVVNQRIVQAWRPANWEPGYYSVVRFELKEAGAETKVILDHTGFHQGDFGHLDSGWHERYWEPLKKFLA
jgi:activator of HSP90 ATPase